MDTSPTKIYIDYPSIEKARQLYSTLRISIVIVAILSIASLVLSIYNTTKPDRYITPTVSTPTLSPTLSPTFSPTFENGGEISGDLKMIDGAEVVGLPAIPSGTGASSKEYVDSKHSVYMTFGADLNVLGGLAIVNGNGFSSQAFLLNGSSRGVAVKGTITKICYLTSSGSSTTVIGIGVEGQVAQVVTLSGLSGEIEMSVPVESGNGIYIEYQSGPFPSESMFGLLIET